MRCGLAAGAQSDTPVTTRQAGACAWVEGPGSGGNEEGRGEAGAAGPCSEVTAPAMCPTRSRHREQSHGEEGQSP